ncbi:DUF6713 family protein [Trichocoleus desertorum]|uniref:DUF6713 family protein n=1 Tax=Trichocoleus TaxID=450526 RepID=UPI001689D3FA|nr:hypothetical protein [Trichocoleus sp. FACHB-46]
MLYKNIYLANATVLLCHQIEAAYWHEWNLFALPGGIQLFVLLNIPIVLVILWGFGAVIRNSASGTIYSWVLGRVLKLQAHHDRG